MEDGPATSNNFLRNLQNINWESLFEKYRLQIFFLLVGLVFVVLGIIFLKTEKTDNQIEVINTENESQEIVVEIEGAVEKPGVYTLKNGDRINDLFVISGGLSADADREWVEMVINKASKLSDGQKIYIPFENEQSDVLSANISGGDQTISSNILTNKEGLININTASKDKLESLSGIGPVYAQNIIEHRPYSTIEELVSKGALKQYVFEKIKDYITIY